MEKPGRAGHPISRCREDNALLGTQPWGRALGQMEQPCSPHPVGARIHPSDALRALPGWVPEPTPRLPSRD